MARHSNTEVLEALAADIGENLYLDIAKWHLYLREAHLHTVLADRLYPLLTSNTLEEDRVVQILREIPVKIGGGRHEIPLTDLLPIQGQVTLMDILEKHQRQL